MRLVLLIAAALVVTACNPAPKEAPPADAAEAGAGAPAGADRAPGAASALLDPISVQGTWSFDRTCASGDGMTLRADGAASYDEWGEGLWAINEAGQLVMILRHQEPGLAADGAGERYVYTLTASEAAGDDLTGQVLSNRPGEEPRDINAKRCP
jgi:hypothetical protein